MDEPEVIVLEERIYPVQGTTKLEIYDAGYDQRGTDAEFHGNISAAPLGLMRIRKERIIYPEIDWEQYLVEVFQASKEDVLKLYAESKHFPKEVKGEYSLNCETASFVIKTKFGKDRFETGGDGDYGKLFHMKQHYGMKLSLWFNDDDFTMDSLEERFLKLFKKGKIALCA